MTEITEKDVAESRLSDTYGHVIIPGEKHFKGHCLKIGRSRSISMKQLAVLRSDIHLSADEIYDTYVTNLQLDLQLDINIYNSRTLYCIKPHFEIHKKQCLE